MSEKSPKLEQARPGPAADTDDVARETERLEAALDRIAAVAASARVATPVVGYADGGDSAPSHIIIDTAAVTSRLDSLIARLKAAVGEA